jgi:hypothetical protein
VNQVQGTVFTFEEDGSGTVLLDDGQSVPFEPEAFAASGLRFLRPGQRVRLTTDASGRVTAVTILTLPDPM